MGTIAIEFPRDQIPDFCRRYKVRKLSLFGSVIHDDFTPESDVDVLVEFEPDAHASYFTLFDMEDELSKLLDGRKVDLLTPQELSRYFRDEVLAEAEVLYDAA
jgi:predicted nucleotidyltransferase